MAAKELNCVFKECPIKFNDSCHASHTLFLKEYKTNKINEKEAVTLLVLNVPPYCDKKHLHDVFKVCGKITNIHVQKNPGKIESTSIDSSPFFDSAAIKGFRVAYITFQSHESLSTALEKDFSVPKCLSVPSKEIHTGLKKWCFDYLQHWPDAKKLQSDIDVYMKDYDARIAKEEEEEMKTDGVADEEGWIKVTRRGRNPGITRTEANEMKLKSKLKIKRKRKEQELLNSYSYQVRESKREKIAEMRRKFEEDKQKIKAMKESRKFKPFG